MWLRTCWFFFRLRFEVLAAVLHVPLRGVFEGFRGISAGLGGGEGRHEHMQCTQGACPAVRWRGWWRSWRFVCFGSRWRRRCAGCRGRVLACTGGFRSSVPCSKRKCALSRWRVGSVYRGFGATSVVLDVRFCGFARVFCRLCGVCVWPCGVVASVCVVVVVLGASYRGTSASVVCCSARCCFAVAFSAVCSSCLRVSPSLV